MHRSTKMKCINILKIFATDDTVSMDTNVHISNVGPPHWVDGVLKSVVVVNFTTGMYESRPPWITLRCLWQDRQEIHRSWKGIFLFLTPSSRMRGGGGVGEERTPQFLRYNAISKNLTFPTFLRVEAYIIQHLWDQRRILEIRYFLSWKRK